MVKHARAAIIKPLIESGHIKEFKDIFINVPKTAVAKDLGIHFLRFNSFLKRVSEMRIEDMYLLCSYFEIAPQKMFELIDAQYNNSRKGTTRKKQ